MVVGGFWDLSFQNEIISPTSVVYKLQSSCKRHHPRSFSIHYNGGKVLNHRCQQLSPMIMLAREAGSCSLRRSREHTHVADPKRLVQCSQPAWNQDRLFKNLFSYRRSCLFKQQQGVNGLNRTCLSFQLLPFECGCGCILNFISFLETAESIGKATRWSSIKI